MRLHLSTASYLEEENESQRIFHGSFKKCFRFKVQTLEGNHVDEI